MVNIKSYKDGDRLVLVIENCTGDIAEKTNNFITSLLGIDITPTQVPLKPIKVAEEPMPEIPKEEMESPKPSENIVNPENKLSSNVEKVSPPTFKSPETVTLEEFREFVNKYSSIIEEDIKTILNMAGYESLDSFLSFTDERQWRDAYDVLLYKVQNQM